eukprot:TRINITY_DN616_c0_g3_i1.p1 TRINITY_DN616_c0_g3~~TRINITY_DN616_c0_g3_i1.p1  ORF type:complete len:689 (+),score=133.12 TRINITY_DN616_c0_g3_i1:10670-12736(+)
MQQRLIVELIKVDLEQRWQRGLRRVIEDYRSDINNLDQYITAPLIFDEYHIRRQAEDEVSQADYFKRFPTHAAELQRLFGMDPAMRSTVVGNADASQKLTILPGDQIDDFDLLLRLGQGAFATVFLARQRSMQRLVAVKISANHGHEPQTLAQLDHNNIIRVYDQRTLPDRGLRLLYMQYAAGGTLAGVIKFMRALPSDQWNGQAYLKAIDSALHERGESIPSESTVRRKIAAMTWPQVVAWVGSQLGQALDSAHRKGVLHRDLKPANVLLTTEGVPKLADFNISFSDNIEGSSPAAYFGGSLAYMSPEQLEACNPGHSRQASDLDGRSDQYSLGILLAELLTGKLPFDDRTICRPWELRLAAMTQLRRSGLDSSRIQLSDGVETGGLDQVLSRCLEPQTERRFATGLDLARELELCLDPAGRRLIVGNMSRWQRFARQFPLTTVSAITVLPNIVAAIFNFIYNHGEIIARMPDAEPTFMRIQAIINMITFPTGMGCASWLAGSVARAVKVDQRHELSAIELETRRQRCLELGNLAAVVGLTLWLIAAPAYPISLHLMLGEVPPQVYAHFVISLALCGLIAAAYPFFGVTFVAIRCFYPRLIRWDSVTTGDVACLQRLSRQCWLYLGLAASVPMIAVTILVLSGSNDRFELVALAGGGVVGFGIALSAFRLVQSDLETLVRLLSKHQD